MSDLDTHVGKYLLQLDITGGGCSPAIEVVMPADTNAEAVAAAITKDFQAALTRHLGEWAMTLPTNGEVGVKARSSSGIIKDKAGRMKDFDDWMDRMGELLGSGEPEESKLNPDDGKHGWWRVDGVRHECFAKATTAAEAIEKASEHVQSWESPSASYIGDTSLEVLG